MSWCLYEVAGCRYEVAVTWHDDRPRHQPEPPAWASSLVEQPEHLPLILIKDVRTHYTQNFMFARALLNLPLLNRARARISCCLIYAILCLCWRLESVGPGGVVHESPPPDVAMPQKPWIRHKSLVFLHKSLVFGHNSHQMSPIWGLLAWILALWRRFEVSRHQHHDYLYNSARHAPHQLVSGIK